MNAHTRAALLCRIYNEPLMIAPAKLQVIMHVLQPEQGIVLIEGEVPAEYMAVRKEPATPPDDRRIAVVEVMGSLMHRTRGLEALSGAVSYEAIGEELRTLRADPRVGGILLRIDSPGGEVAGVYELAKTVRETAEAKPTWAVIDGMGLSAGYLIASQTSKILLSTHASVGSIGIIMIHQDQSAANERIGLKYSVLKRGAHKDDFNPHAPLSEGATKFANELLDQEYNLFVEHVASGRKLPEKKIRDTEARIYFDDDALKLGLADGQATYHEALSDMQAALAAPKRVAQIQGGQPMGDQATPTPTQTPAPTTTAAASPSPPAPAPVSTMSEDDYREIAALCTIARRPHLAAQFIIQRKSVAEVRQLLSEGETEQDSSTEVFSAFAPGAGLAQSLLNAKPRRSTADLMRERLGLKARA